MQGDGATEITNMEQIKHWLTCMLSMVHGKRAKEGKVEEAKRKKQQRRTIQAENCQCSILLEFSRS